MAGQECERTTSLHKKLFFSSLLKGISHLSLVDCLWPAAAFSSAGVGAHWVSRTGVGAHWGFRALGFSPALACSFNRLFDVEPAQCAHPVPVETGQVLLTKPRVPLASEGLDPGQFGGDGDVLELRFEP